MKMSGNTLVILIITGLAVISITLFAFVRIQLLFCTEQVPITIEKISFDRYGDGTYSYIYEGEKYFFETDSSEDYVWINPDNPGHIIQPDIYYRISETIFLIDIFMFMFYILSNKKEWKKNTKPKL